jgi:hypothetical protein
MMGRWATCKREGGECSVGGSGACEGTVGACRRGGWGTSSGERAQKSAAHLSGLAHPRLKHALEVAAARRQDDTVCRDALIPHLREGRRVNTSRGYVTGTCAGGMCMGHGAPEHLPRTQGRGFSRTILVSTAFYKMFTWSVTSDSSGLFRNRRQSVARLAG